MHKLPAIITLNHIASQLPSLKKLLKKDVLVEFDLSEVKHIDSAGIAMLLELRNIAFQLQCQLKFINSNNVIERLSKLYKVELT